MSESKFKQLQQDACSKTPEEILEESKEPDKICPTCIPNPSYVEPDWAQSKEPYLNEKQCEYQVKMMINFDADVYYDSTQRLIATSAVPEGSERKRFVKLTDSPYPMKTLLKSYIRPAVRKMLRFYNKLETDEIVCASPPQSEGEICKGIFGLDYEEYIIREDQLTDDPVPQSFSVVEIDKAVLSMIPDIKNIQALELFARVKDYTFITKSKILIVHIGIPAYKFDAVPDAPDLGSLDTGTDKIVIKPPDFMNTIQRFQSAMNSFKTFQSYFYREENGSLYFEETGNPFYIKFYAEERINKFVDRLNSLLNKNNFDLRGFLDTGTKSNRIAYEIEVSFDKTDESKPFVVKSVRARKNNCPYINCGVGLSSFIEYSKNDQTMMGYFSDINNIDSTLDSNKTPPWLDFIVSKTFPQLAVNYGSSGNFKEDSCLSVNFNDMSDFILDEAMDLFKAIEYRYNQNACKTKQEMIQQNRSIKDLFSGENAKQLDALKDAWNTGQRKVKDLEFSFFEAELVSTETAVSEFIKNFNPCDLQFSLQGAIKCLSASLTLDEVYHTLIKQIISASGEAALEVILNTLPANKRQEIETKIREQFKDMPYPWEPGWEAGSLGESVDRQTAKNIQDKKDRPGSMADLVSAEYTSMSTQGKIEELEKTIQALTGVEYEDAYRERIKDKIATLEPEVEKNVKSINDQQARKTSLLQDIESLNIEIEQLRIKFDFATEEMRKTTSDEEEIILMLEQKGQQIATRLGGLETQLRLNTVAIKDADFQIATNREKNIALLETIQTEKNTLEDSYWEQSGPFYEKIRKDVAKLTAELEKLKKKKFEADTTTEDIQQYDNFKNLPPDQQQEVIDKQKQKTAIVSTTPSDEIKQGTLGKAAGNVQKALTQAYIDEIMKTASIGELQRAIENIPGADLLGKIISRFECGKDPLVYPPIDSFLSTLTFDPCGTEKTRISLPEIRPLELNFNWLEQLGDAMYIALREVASRVIVALIIKTTELLKTDLCQAIGDISSAGLGAIEDGGFGAFVSDFICPDPKTDEDRNAVNKALLEAGGARGRSDTSYRDLANLLSVSATQKEIKQAMVGRPENNFIENISFLVKNVLPQFADLFSDSQSTNQFFLTMGNFLTPEQRNNIIDELEDPLDEFPVDLSICLTKEAKDLWDQNRLGAFSDPEVGKEYVRKQDERNKSNLADAADLLLNGTDGALEKAIDDAFGKKDPDCKPRTGNTTVVPGFNDYPKNKQEVISNAITGIFKVLEKAFIDDTIEDNFFNPFNPSGILLEILSDKRTLNLAKHMLAKNNFFFQLIFGQLGAELEFPETVGIQLKQYIDSYETTYEVGKNIVLFYDNQKENVSGLRNTINKFTSTLVVNESIPANGAILFEDRWSEINFTSNNFLKIPESYQTENSQLPLGAATLGKMIEVLWSEFGMQFEPETFKSFFEGMNTEIYNKLPKKFTERQEGQISEGFLFGNEDTPILEDSDLVYVGPNGEEPYEDFFTEDDKVLGRSKTNNPRVHFLDPNKHGGTYLAPNVYIAEADHKGWLQFSKIIVPNPTGCDPKNSNFLMLDSLIKQIDKNKQIIKNHELLSFSPECTVELPFDKIATADTLATLEAIVRATIRVYLSDFLIRSFPVFSNVHLDVDRNYDNLVLNYITEKVHKGIASETALFTSTYEGNVYALLFLEQVVQIVSRKVKNGEMESNQEIEEILAECNALQEAYPLLYNRDVFNYNLYTKGAGQVINYPQADLDKFTAIQRGTTIIGSGGFDLLNALESIVFYLVPISIEQARFAVKIDALNSVKSSMKKLLKYVVKEELEVYTKKMRDELEPRPWIYDIKKFFIGGSGIMLGDQIQAGVYDAEVPIGSGAGSLPYGDIIQCASADMNHALNNTQITDKRFEQLSQNGGFYLEKYLVCSPKKNKNLVNIAKANGLINIKELKRFLSDNRLNLSIDKNISDYFGNAVLADDGLSYEGGIGIKYGVRLCFIPPKDFDLPLQINNVSREKRSFVQSPAAFETESGRKLLESSKFSFPICSYEEDILDIKIEELLNSNDNLNQDLKCYVDKMTKTENFTHLMDNVLQIKKIPSLYMIYSYVNLIPSLGAPSERTVDDTMIVSQADIAKSFKDSKAQSRSLFVSFYRNDDRDPPNEETNNEDVVKSLQRKAMNAISFINYGEFSWDMRRRIVKENPLDKDGNECKNNFGKLFTIGGN